MTDQDENDVITCVIEDGFTVSDSTLKNVTKSPPFEIDENQKIKLRFTVQASMKGYFALNVTCTDEGTWIATQSTEIVNIVLLSTHILAAHSTRAAIKIYVFTKENKVDIVFNNTQAEIEEKRTQVHDE